MTKCNQMLCNKNASYGTIYKNPIHCKEHKKENEVNVKHKRCNFPDCIKVASYAKKGESALHCKTHKEEEEIDTRHTTCEYKECLKRPIYGLPKQKARHCKEHKEEKEIDLNNKITCKEEGCNKRPSYGPSAGIRIHCFKHKKENEYNTKHKRCEFPDCKVQASYGVQKPPKHCFKHKKENEVNVVSGKCVYKNCNKRRTHGIRGQSMKRCSEHQESYDFNLNSKRCVCNTYLVSIEPFKCQYCNPNSKLRKKTKEHFIVNYFKEKLPEHNFIHNKSVGSHCTKNEKKNSNGHLFPDIRFDCLYYNLIIEVDEFQHRGANYKCDEQRMYDIIAKLGQPCVFIRYNPDNKKSSKEYLLDRVKYYLDYKTINIKDTFSIGGLKTEYLFYN